MEKREQIYEGKAKKVFATDDPHTVIAPREGTVPDGLNKNAAAGKGAINNRMTSNLIRRAEGTCTEVMARLMGEK